MSNFLSKQTEKQTVNFTVPAEFVSPKELARRVDGSTQSLANDRHKGIGLPYIKRGKSVLYFWPEVVEILRAGRIEPRRA